MSRPLTGIFLLLFPVIAMAQQDTVVSRAYDWIETSTNTDGYNRPAVLFEGETRDMLWMQVTANKLSESKNETRLVIPGDQEQLMIIKKGELTVTVKDQTVPLVPGSVVVLMPGENFSYRNSGSSPAEFFLIKYRSKSPVDKERAEKAGGSFIVDWNQLEFKPHDRGGIRNYFERPTAMGKRLEMHVSTLKAGIRSHDPHTHRAAEIVLMIEGNTVMQIGKKFYKGKAGSLFFLGSNSLHAIRNAGDEPCMYFAFQFE